MCLSDAKLVLWDGEGRWRARDGGVGRDELGEVVQEHLAFIVACESARAVLGERDG